MTSPRKLNEIHQRLSLIHQLSEEIENVPNLLPDLWSMKKIDKKCQEIQMHCEWVSSALGTGGSGTGDGYSDWNDHDSW